MIILHTIIQAYLLGVNKLIIEIKRKTFDPCPISALFPEVTPVLGVAWICLEDFSFCPCTMHIGTNGNV